MLEDAISETVSLLELILPKMFLGIVAGSFIVSLPIFKSLVKVFARVLRMKSGVAVAAFFANKVVSLSILSEMYRRGVVDEREVLIASVVGSFPLALRSVILTLAPVAFSTLGFKLGLAFLTIHLASKFIVAIGAFLVGRKAVENCEVSFDYSPSLTESLLTALKTFVRISTVLIFSVFLTSVAFNAGGVVDGNLAILIAGAASTLAGFGAAGSLLSRGEVNEESVLVLLFVALAFHRVVESFRFSMPLNVSFFGGRFGVKLTFFTLLANEISCAICIILSLVLVFLRIL